MCQVYLTNVAFNYNLNVRLTLHQWEDKMKNDVKRRRELKGLTQTELGKAVNVSRQAINAIENNKFDPSIWLAYDLSKFFNCKIEELFNFKESERK